jgi:hypothetical protein
MEDKNLEVRFMRAVRGDSPGSSRRVVIRVPMIGGAVAMATIDATIMIIVIVDDHERAMILQGERSR